MNNNKALDFGQAVTNLRIGLDDYSDEYECWAFADNPEIKSACNRKVAKLNKLADEIDRLIGAVSDGLSELEKDASQI